MKKHLLITPAVLAFASPALAQPIEPMWQCVRDAKGKENLSTKEARDYCTPSIRKLHGCVWAYMDKHHSDRVTANEYCCKQRAPIAHRSTNRRETEN